MRVDINKILSGIAILILAGSITTLANTVIKVERLETKQSQYENNVKDIKDDIRDLRNYLIGPPKLRPIGRN